MNAPKNGENARKSAERLDELLWQRFDRVIAANELQQLEKALEGDAAARGRAADLRDFAELLGAVEDVEPPSVLRQRIDEALDASIRFKKGPSPWVEAWRDLWAPRPGLRFASLAAALLLGAVGYHLIAGGGTRGPGADPSKVYGTAGLLPGSGTDARAHTLELPDSRGALAFYRQGAFLVADLSFSLKTDAVASLTLGNGFRLEASEHFSSSPSRLRTTIDGLTLELTGPGRFVFTLSVSSQQRDLGVRVSSEGRTLLETTLELDEIPESRN